MYKSGAYGTDVPLPRYFQPKKKRNEFELQPVSQAQQVIYVQSPQQQPAQNQVYAVPYNGQQDNQPQILSYQPATMPAFLPNNQYLEEPPNYAGSSVQRYPSLETLAVKLNMPQLMDLTAVGVTTERLSTMRQQEAVEVGISKEDFFKIKEFFVNSR
jgi:hypothetical protein